MKTHPREGSHESLVHKELSSHASSDITQPFLSSHVAMEHICSISQIRSRKGRGERRWGDGEMGRWGDGEIELESKDIRSSAGNRFVYTSAF